MDIFAYPSSPGPAYLLSTNGEDAITIAWSPPADSGILPVKQYVVEHYDTSQEHLGWRVIHRPNGKESLLIDGLSPEGSHFFIIRATNSHGTGPSSAIAGPMRTIAGERLYQLELQRRKNPFGTEMPTEARHDANMARERLMNIATSLLSLTPVSSSSIRLQWSTLASSNSSSDQGIGFSPLNSLAMSDYLEGYSIRYRAVGIGESLLSKDPLLGTNWTPNNLPSSLPLITSYVDEEETMSIAKTRRKRDISGSFYDFTQEFNEVRVADHSTEHYTVNALRPFTMYQFFVVPYYKDIDGVPSNILSAQTNEDRPSVAPPNLTIRPVNNTAIRLLWLHIPPIYANGIIRGYVVRINRSDILSETAQQSSQLSSVAFTPTSSTPKTYTVPLSGLTIAPLTAFNPESKLQPSLNGIQQYVVMYDVANLTYKSFYSIQVAGSTSVGPGPWSEAQNFVMDAKILSNQLKFASNEFDDVMSKSILTGAPQSYENYPPQMQGISSNGIFIILPVLLIIISISFIVCFILYRRNNQKVVTWKKTISEHFTNKFYMPSAVDHHLHQTHARGGPGSLQQNIYDHQQHLIYSAGSAQIVPSVVQNQNMWGAATMANGGINSSGTGSLSSHGAGGLMTINTDPNAMRAKVNNGDQVILMNGNHIGDNKDIQGRFGRGVVGPTQHQLMHQSSMDSARSLTHHPNHHQIIHHGGDYYSVINNVAEYEELDQQQLRQGMQLMNGNERHQMGSSNSDTSCPSSVTRLLPNQNYNRDLLRRNLANAEQQQRQEMILQQQHQLGNGKQPFITMINGNENGAKFQQQQSKSALSPYATTNLTNQMVQQQQQQNLFPNGQISLIDQTRLQQHQQQQNFSLHVGGIGGGGGGGTTTMDDSKVLMGHHQMNAAGVVGMGGVEMQNHSFRTLQRNTPNNFHANASLTPNNNNNQVGQIFVQNDMQTSTHVRPMKQIPNYGLSLGQYHGGANVNNDLVTTNITLNPMNSADSKSNFYEHIDYSALSQEQQFQQHQHQHQQQQQQNNQFKQTNGELAQGKQERNVSASSSNGSVRSPPSKQSPEQQQQQSKFKKGSSANGVSSTSSGSMGLNGGGEEAHDLRVFTSAHAPRGASFESAASGERQRLTMNGNSGGIRQQHEEDEDDYGVIIEGGGTMLSDSAHEGQGFANDQEDNEDQADETTALRRGQPMASNSSEQPQRARQLSKRKRQQQRSRQHNNNQKMVN